ncbi:MAG: NUDIX hydrolase [Bacteroidia bacterium]|nr:NUDIX hydrolase [Bacteroidia bacterium]
MNKTTVLEQLEAYQPTHAEDRRFKAEMIHFVNAHHDFASRHNPAGHLTASAWMVNPDRSQVLLLHHRKLNLWLQPGGHIEDDASLLAAALREAREETGLTSLIEVSPEIFDLDIHLIPARKQDPEHPHLDVRFLLEADPGEPLILTPESNQLRWFSRAEIQNMDLDWSVLRMLEKV